jgi:phospholipid-binding lipoprotein MlaA
MKFPAFPAAALRGGLLAVLSLGLLAGCASTGGSPDAIAPDPLQPLNRITSTMNRVMDDAVVRPITQAYVDVAPRPVRISIGHFFDNLSEPIVIVNDLLQGKFRQTGADTGRFLVNTTFGVIGLFDPATAMGLPQHDEDLGQTLAVWGVPPGPYVVLPLLGPSTVRDGLGRYVDALANPISPTNASEVSTRNAAYVLEGVDTRSQLLDLQKQIKQAFDRYVFIRDAWLQHRQYKVYDGNPPLPKYPDLPPEPDSENNDN